MSHSSCNPSNCPNTPLRSKESEPSRPGSAPSSKGSACSRQGSACSRQGSALSRQVSASSRTGSSRLRAPAPSCLVEPKSSMSKTQTCSIQKTCSGTKMIRQTRVSATMITKKSDSKQSCGGGTSGVARIRMESTPTKASKSNVQTTKVIVVGAGLKPTGTMKQSCPAVCSRKSSQPILEPVGQGQTVPPGMYYMPLPGASTQGLGPEEQKLRQKLQKYTPTSLSHWKVQNPDPFIRNPGPMRQAHPDMISGNFRAGRTVSPGRYQPDNRNPHLEQRLDSSQPVEHWSLSLREAMALQAGVYEQENPVSGKKETYTVENTVIERQVDTQPVCDVAMVNQDLIDAVAAAHDEIPVGNAFLKAIGKKQLRKPSRPCSNASLKAIGKQQLRKPSPPCKHTPREPKESKEKDSQSLPGGQSCEVTTPQDQCSREGAVALPPQPDVQTPLLCPVRGPPNLQNLQRPEHEHTVHTSEVAAPRMQSPLGEIDAQHTIVLQRQVHASELGTTVATAVRGTKLLAPGQAKQIDIVKQDRLPPPKPPLQYVMTPRGGPPGLRPCPGGRSPNSSMMAQCGSPAGSPGSWGFSPNGSSPQMSQQTPGSPFLQQATPSKTPAPPSPVNLDATARVPDSPKDVTLDVLRRLVDEERQDVHASQELPPALVKKLNKLKKKPQSMRILEETLDQSVPIDEESDNVKSDIIAELMHSLETGVTHPTNSPQKTYDQLFPFYEEEQQVSVSPAAPAPLSDIVVPVGEPDVDAVAMVNQDIVDAAPADDEEIPAGNAFSEAVAEAEPSETPPREPKESEDGAECIPCKESEDGEDDAAYIPRGELDEQIAPWEINLGSLEGLVGGKMSMMSAWDNLPSDESVRATAGRLEYVLDVQKPQHHSCVQLRGSQLPAWFPGYYSVLPHVEGCVRLERSPSRAFAAAWHVFAPHQCAEETEIVFL